MFYWFFLTAAADFQPIVTLYLLHSRFSSVPLCLYSMLHIYSSTILFLIAHFPLVCKYCSQDIVARLSTSVGKSEWRAREGYARTRENTWYDVIFGSTRSPMYSWSPTFIGVLTCEWGMILTQRSVTSLRTWQFSSEKRYFPCSFHNASLEFWLLLLVLSSSYILLFYFYRYFLISTFSSFCNSLLCRATNSALLLYILPMGQMIAPLGSLPLYLSKSTDLLSIQD